MHPTGLLARIFLDSTLRVGKYQARLMPLRADRVSGNDSLTALLARSALGEREAFAALYRSTSPKVFGVLLHILKRRDWAEEALQEAYLNVWSHAGEYRPDKGTPITWLVSIARYRAFDMLRKAERVNARDASAQTVDALSNEDASPSEALQLYDHHDYRALQDCLAQLDEKQRRSLVMAYCEGFTHAELSQHLRTPLGTVKSWIRRGLQQLRQCLQA